MTIELINFYLRQALLWLDNFVRTTSPDIFIINSIIIYFVLHTLRMIFILLRNKQLAINSRRFEGDGSGERRILILGDSTAVGTGSTQPEDTIAGRLAHDFPTADIINLGKNGGLISDVRAQVDQVKNQTFDLIIISAGGNDVWHLSRLSKIERDLSYIFTETTKMSHGNVFCLIYNNIGDAPIFPFFLRRLLKLRCDAVYRRIEKAAQLKSIRLIDLFSKTDHNIFLAEPERLFASDGIHPSSEGYKMWYLRMWREMIKRGYHFSR